MEKQLAEVPLGELQKARADGSLSSYRNRRAGENVFGRANKNRLDLFMFCLCCFMFWPRIDFKLLISFGEKAGRD